MSKHIDIDKEELRELIARVEHAIEHELALSSDDLKLLLLAINTLLAVHSRMEKDDVTLNKLKKLLGMITKSESRRKRGSTGKKNKRPKNKKARQSKPPKEEHHKSSYSKGSHCPHCNTGKLYKHNPAILLRITGHAPFNATKHISEQLRCNGCQQIITANLPDEVLADGHANQQYGYSARALMVLNKFYTGTPYNHLSNLSDIMGCSISASTIYDQCVLVANDIEPIFNELKKQAANAELIDIDDTSNRILEQKAELRDKRNGKGKQLRTGVYTSGMVATTGSKEIILFETSLGHAGEHLDAILDLRTTEQSPVVMSDALSSNNSKHQIIQTYCNAHSRRNFYDIEDKYPEQVKYVLYTYGKIWTNEHQTKDDNLTTEQRLEYHKEHSLPVMQELQSWSQEQQQSPEFEEHDALGKAINYFLRHYEKLTQFCSVIDAKLDNNRMEERLKTVIRGRKLSHFYKTENGATVANKLLSLIATADVAGINPFDYLQILQRHRLEVKANPIDWLPWNYQETLVTLKQKSQTDQNAA